MRAAALLLPLSLIATASCSAISSSGNARTSGSAAGDPGAGARATDFTLRDTDGKVVRLSDFLGKEVVLIDFWATWCEPCKAELPHLAAIYQANHAKGFTVLAISMDGPETVAQVGPYVRRYKLAFPVLLDEETTVVNIYNPKRTAPLSVLIDRKGEISKVRSGYNAGDEKLIAEDVARLLGKQ